MQTTDTVATSTTRAKAKEKTPARAGSRSQLAGRRGSAKHGGAKHGGVKHGTYDYPHSAASRVHNRRLYALAGCMAVGLAAGGVLTALTGYLAFDLSSGPAGAAASARDGVAAVAGLIAAAVAAGFLCGAVLGTFERGGQQRKVGRRDTRNGRPGDGISLTRALNTAVGSTSAGAIGVLALAVGGGWLYPGMVLAIVAMFYLAFAGFLVSIGTYLGMLYLTR